MIPPVRVLLVDDQDMIRDGLRMVLEAQPDLEVVGEAGDGAEAVDLVRRTDPHVVLMDVRMPGVDGIEATRRIAAQGPPPHVLVLTTFDTDEHVHDALHAGASGFLLKSAPASRLVEAVRVVAHGEALLAPGLTRRLVERHLRPRPRPDPAFDRLTERERDVAVHIARGATNAEIAAALTVSEATVKTHVNHVLAKLEARDRVQVVVRAYESGLVRPGDA